MDDRANGIPDKEKPMEPQKGPCPKKRRGSRLPKIREIRKASFPETGRRKKVSCKGLFLEESYPDGRIRFKGFPRETIGVKQLKIHI